MAEELPFSVRAERKISVRRAFITSYCRDFALAATERYWDLDDGLWADFASEFPPSPEELGKWRAIILKAFLDGARKFCQFISH
ncbi:MAG: hypothetical protein WBC70_15225 [Candidatus Aminicenantales bacterium]